MSIFDGTTLNEEILKHNQFVNIGNNKWMTRWFANIKFKYRRPESCVVSIIIDRYIYLSIFKVSIAISTKYGLYAKRMEIKDSIEFYTLLNQLKDIKYEYLTSEFLFTTDK